MKKELKIGLLGLLTLVLVIVSYNLYVTKNINYLIISGTFALISGYAFVEALLSNRSEEALYKSKVSKILRTYDSILVKSKNIPKLEEKNIIRVDTIEDLVDAQMELRKPIYYQEQVESCSFILLDNDEACIFILKSNENVICPLEITLNELEIKHKQEKNKEEVPDELLKDIESTTIVRVDKGKYLKVSPVRNKKKKNKADENNSEKENSENVINTENKENVEEKKNDVKNHKKEENKKQHPTKEKNDVEIKEESTEEKKDDEKTIIKSENPKNKENKNKKKEIEVLDL